MNVNNETNKFATQVGECEIVITRVFDAPRALVFDAWTKEENLSKWWGLEVLRPLPRSLI